MYINIYIYIYILYIHIYIYSVYKIKSTSNEETIKIPKELQCKSSRLLFHLHVIPLKYDKTVFFNLMLNHTTALESNISGNLCTAIVAHSGF